ncbi:hypothetical protein EZS27_037866 [termite gut metagenome]|uniref:Transposase IS4-like domain-containing protein n=1 Tax=termite gut metagenome TaxID=433724 RepID=A0A5J4PMV0_9ZZZZ
MNNFSTNYRKIVEALRTIESKKNFLHQIRQPKLSDIELIGVDLTAEYMGIDSEYQLFRLLPDSLSGRIERSVYNRRRRRLFSHRERIRKVMSEKITSDRDYYIVDSMPLEVCKLSRSSRCCISKEDIHTSPDTGYCATQKIYYYGYKLYAICSIEGVFSRFDLTKASVHDIHYLQDVKLSHQNCVILADKGYLSRNYQLDLFESNHLKMEVPMNLSSPKT